jgi:hypothetical protein
MNHQAPMTSIRARRFSKLTLVACCAALAACATQIKLATTDNPPPSKKFSAFNRFELKEIELASDYEAHAANQKATRKIQEHFHTRMQPVVDEWNTRSKARGSTLLIEPRIEQIKFIGIGARIWVGPLAGSSAVHMKVRYVDKHSGEVIAEPEFYQRAAALSGATTFGYQDNDMLYRIVSLVTRYTTNNYHQAVGGESGGTADARSNER